MIKLDHIHLIIIASFYKRKTETISYNNNNKCLIYAQDHQDQFPLSNAIIDLRDARLKKLLGPSLGLTAKSWSLVTPSVFDPEALSFPRFRWTTKHISIWKSILVYQWAPIWRFTCKACSRSVATDCLSMVLRWIYDTKNTLQITTDSHKDFLCLLPLCGYQLPCLSESLSGC